MKLAYTTTFSANDIQAWSGTPYHMSKALTQAGIQLDHIDNLKRVLPPFFKVKQILKKYVAQTRESPRFNIAVAQAYSAQVAQQLSTRHADVVLSPLINPIAYLDCTAPIVLWTDAVYAGLVGFYPPFAYHSAKTIQQGNAMTAACLSRCALAIFSSHWAAQTAMQYYGIRPEKVRVVNYGANLETTPDLSTVTTHIHRRNNKTIKLLFLAKSWERKGGDIVMAVAEALYQAGYPVELNVVGYMPPLPALPHYIHYLGFISKGTAEGKAKLAQLFHEAHFLFLPSRADACPMVLAEANAYGVPCLTSSVGGIKSAIMDHVNGMTFPLDTPITAYCEYITNVLANEAHYRQFALQARDEYDTKLNWRIATHTVKQFMQDVA